MLLHTKRQVFKILFFRMQHALFHHVITAVGIPFLLIEKLLLTVTAIRRN